MCVDRKRLVPIPELLWQADAIHNFDPNHPEYALDEDGRKCLALDECIADAVQALWNAGVVTVSCCCLHGEGYGSITLGRAIG